MVFLLIFSQNVVPTFTINLILSKIYLKRELLHVLAYLNYVVSDHQGAHVNTRDLLLNHLLYRPHAEWVTAAVTWLTCQHLDIRLTHIKARHMQ